jgi:ComF family protein
MSDRIAFVYAHWMFDKTGVVQLLHRNLKYGNRPLSGQALGRQIGKSLRASFSDDRLPDRIVPIPLHRRRFYERGYNQSFALAQGIRSATGIPLAANALFRRVHTQTQTGLGQFDRWKNVASAFEVQAPEVLSGRHVVVVDDVLTTGATLLAASNKLLEAGAHAVSFATLAFARP